MFDVSNISSATEHGLDMVALFFDSINAAKEKGFSLPKPQNFEAKLTEFMKLWGSSPRLGIFVDAAAEAKMKNVAHFLGEAVFSEQRCPDPKDRLTEEEMVFLQLVVKLSCMTGGIAFKINNLPPSPGYEQLLKEKGYSSFSARAMSHLIRRSGERQAKEQQLRLSVVQALRGLATNRPLATLLRHARYELLPV